MLNGRVLRIGLISVAVILTFTLYFLPRTSKTASESAEKPEAKGSIAFDNEHFIKDAKSRLPWKDAGVLDSLDQLIAKESSGSVLYDSAAAVWDRNSNPGIAAWYLEQKASKTGAEKDWLGAGYRYFDAFKSTNDSVTFRWFVSKAIESYSKVIELNPSNLNAKTDLGVLYAEGTGEPMKGIMMLREVVQTDSLHENAQMNLGFLSMKSGQYAKAVDRFKTVLRINPNRIEMYVYLAQAQVESGDKEGALKNLRIFRNVSKDDQMNLEVDNYIKEIEKSNN